MASKNESVIRDVALYIYHAIVRRSTLLTNANNKCHVCTLLYNLYICCNTVLWAGGLYHVINFIHSIPLELVYIQEVVKHNPVRVSVHSGSDETESRLG